MEGGYDLKGLSVGGSGRSRKGKKSGGGGGSEKPLKQPQRGLGVAQLEKIRLQSQMSEYVNSSTASSFRSDLDLDDPKAEMMRSSSAAPSSSSSNMGSASASSSLFSLHNHHHHHHQPGSTMGYGDGERRSFNYGDQYWPNYPSTRSQQQGGASFNYYAPPTTVTLPLFERSLEQDQSMTTTTTTTTTQKKRSQHDRSSSMGSSISTRINIFSDSNEETEEEVDLELRLSL